VDLDELDHPQISLFGPAGKIPGQAFERTVSFIILIVKNQGYFMAMQAPMPRKVLFCNEFYEWNPVDSRGKSLTTRGNYSNQFHRTETGGVALKQPFRVVCEYGTQPASYRNFQPTR
jgi:hypothetical protein